MKYEKTKEDIDIEKHDLQNNRTMKHLKDANYFKFQVGDVLLHQHKNYSTQEYMNEEHQCGLPVRYVYAFENELGLGYIRRLSVDGKRFVGSATSVLEFDPDRERFALDPSYADHLILGGEDEQFDTKSEYATIKSKRAKCRRLNEKLRHKFETVAEAETFIQNMKPGDQFWYAWSSSDLEKDGQVVKSIGKEGGTTDWRGYKVPEKWYIEYHHAKYNYDYKLYGDNLVKSWFLTTQPHRVSDLL